MSDAFDKLSKVLSKFPTELRNLSIHDDVNKLKTKFENKKYFFGEFLTKIVIFGKVSTGKSTLINALLEKKIFGTTTAHGTVSFFYCTLSGKDYEYFTVNNNDREYIEIDKLKYAAKLNEYRDDYFDQNSVIKVFIQHDGSRLLEKKTVIVDCPGLDHNAEYDEAVKKNCSNADILIFMFDIDAPATSNQIDFIKNIRDTQQNPACFFVYNKCDLSNFNERMKSTLSTELYKLFGEKYTKNIRVNVDPLYFISAENPNQFVDFARLKNDIMINKDINFFRYINVKSQISNEMYMFRDLLTESIYNENEKLSSLRRFNEMKNHLLNFVKRRIENCKNNLLLDRIFDIIITEIKDYEGKCNPINASIMISKIEGIIIKKVNRFIESHLFDSCIDPINTNIKEINSIANNNDMVLQISGFQLVTPNYKAIKNLFWWFEFGDKTLRVKEFFIEFIQSYDNKKKINDSIKYIYTNELSKIQMHYEEFLEKSSLENIRCLENKIDILTNYKNEFSEKSERFNSSNL